MVHDRLSTAYRLYASGHGDQTCGRMSQHEGSGDKRDKTCSSDHVRNPDFHVRPLLGWSPQLSVLFLFCQEHKKNISERRKCCKRG